MARSRKKKSQAGEDQASQDLTELTSGGEGTSSGPENISGYWKRIFAEQPRLLRGGSNTRLYEIWLNDHPGQLEVPRNAKQVLSNVKSSLKKQKGERPRRERAEVSETPASNGARVRAPRPARNLTQLEEQIDECLSLAKDLDRERLSRVISHLRDARNLVVVLQSH